MAYWSRRRYFFIRSALSGQVLDVAGNSTDPGTKVITWDHKGAGSSNQLWFADSHTCTIRSKLDDNLCLTINDDNDLTVDHYRHDNNDQEWMVMGDKIVNKNDHNRVLDVAADCTDCGARVCAWAAHGKDNQCWNFEYDEDHVDYFYIKSKHSGDVLDVVDGNPSPGTEVCMWSRHDEEATNQLWYTDYMGVIHSKLNDAVLDSSQGDLVINPQEPGNMNQMWVLKGEYIINMYNPSQVLDIKGGRKRDGARLCAYEVHGGDNQKWEIIEV